MKKKKREKEQFCLNNFIFILGSKMGEKNLILKEKCWKKYLWIFIELRIKFLCLSVILSIYIKAIIKHSYEQWEHLTILFK